jgi:RNA polymerase sigma-70 factor (ECF subfamily)
MRKANAKQMKVVQRERSWLAGGALKRDACDEAFAPRADAQMNGATMNVLAHRAIGGSPPRSPAWPQPGQPGLGALGTPRVRAEELTQHLPRLRSVLRRLLRDPGDVDDVLQDVMVTALQKLPTFRGEAQLGTWLHRIAVNAALLYRRRKARLAAVMPHRLADKTSEVHLRDLARKQPERPDREVLKQEEARLILRAIASLPPMYRDVFVLADVNDQSNGTIARALALKLPAVKSRLHRARRMMRDQLAHYSA